MKSITVSYGIFACLFFSSRKQYLHIQSKVIWGQQILTILTNKSLSSNHTVMPSHQHKMAEHTVGTCRWVGPGLTLHASMSWPGSPTSWQSQEEEDPAWGSSKACWGSPGSMQRFLPGGPASSWLCTARPAQMSWGPHLLAPCSTKVVSRAPAYLFGEIHQVDLNGRGGPTSLGQSMVGLPHFDRAEGQAALSPTPSAWVSCTGPLIFI